MEKGRGGVKKGALILLAVFSVLLLSVAGETQEKKEQPSKKEGAFGLTSSRSPIDITSDTVEGSQKQNTFTFKGNVIARQENTTLYANLMVVYYDPETKQVKEIVVTGNVKIVQLERRATSQKAVFYQNENKVVLEGDAIVREGENVIRGERVIYYLDDERSIVEGGKGNRVSTTITPSKKE
jgi:lipopolysaccharide export system protein LptA